LHSQNPVLPGFFMPSIDNMQKLLFILAVLQCSVSIAQTPKDSVAPMNSILIRGYETNAIALQTPAAVSQLNARAIKAVSTYSILPAFNQVAGVRMEERSPGSYRLSIRGSLLRSPFGVRNVKVYFDDYVFTDAGGNAYLNLLDAQLIGQAEIIKGPAGSGYGAGTGGAVLLGSANLLGEINKDTAAGSIMVAGGRFGSFNESVQYQVNRKSWQLHVMQGHAQADGYRNQSALKKDNLMLKLTMAPSEKMSSALQFLLADLRYETPGGLTFAQREANPRQSRPATSVLPSAADQRAAIFNKTAMAGFTNTYALGGRWKMVSSLSTTVTGFKNPFITNFEKRNETNVGLRTKFMYEQKGKLPLQWINGVEVQRGGYQIDSTGNKSGVPDKNLVRDQVVARQQFVFTQLNLTLWEKVRLQTGLSVNNFTYRLERTIGLPAYGNLPVDFNVQVLPRVALMLEPVGGVGLYAQLAKGYASPTLAEIRPSAGGVYRGLQAEYGWNQEAGVKWTALRGRLFASATFFKFELLDAIVRQTNATGAEYFVNAGSTLQKGFEGEWSFLVINKPRAKAVQRLLINQSLTQYNFIFRNYSVAGNNFSGKQLTGIPREGYALSAQLDILRHWQLNVAFNYTGRIPLNDANTVFADPYRLWTGRLNWVGRVRQSKINLFLILDNIGDVRYSLGNDLNAFGGRFYNPSPGRNLQAGCSVGF
jgi:iron complex outermembrane recepter protein